MGVPWKDRKTRRRPNETTFQPAWMVEKRALSVALPPGRQLDLSPGRSALLPAPIPFQRVQLGQGWAADNQTPFYHRYQLQLLAFCRAQRLAAGE